MARLKIAIVGGGPGGLSAAIELAKLPFVQLVLYEKGPKIGETGGGFTLQLQTWRLLEKNGVAQNLQANDLFRSKQGCTEQRRNGRTGELLSIKNCPDDMPSHRQSCRLTRSTLQKALLQSVDQTCIRLSKRLVKLEQLPNNQVRIVFEDGEADDVDLLVAADGIRSCIRKFSFPEHTLHYNGQSVYRTIVSKADASKIKNLPWAPVFWKHTSGLYVFTCPLGDDDFEVTARILRPKLGQEPVSWGLPFELDSLLHEYDDFCQPVREVLRLAARGESKEFALFSGPRLRHVTSYGNIAFIGDASHAMLGNFGCGVGFALEDVYTLARVLDWGWLNGKSLANSLDLFDSIRSPHYERLHEDIAKCKNIKSELRAECLPLDQEIAERVRRISIASDPWMYHYEIEKIVEEAFRAEKERDTHGTVSL